MIEVSILSTDGSEHHFKYPTNIGEITLSQYVLYSVHNDKVFKYLEDNKLEDSNYNYYLYLIAKVVSIFADIDIEDVLLFDVSKLVDNEGNLSLEVFNEHIKNISESKDITINFSSVNLTLMSLYELSLNVVSSYKFEFKSNDNFIITIKGKNYEIPHVIKTMFDGTKVFSNFSVAQAVETMQVKNKLATLIKDGNLDDDKQANFNYSSILNIVAITLWEVDSSIPLDQNTFDQEVLLKMDLFKDMNAKDALDISFFLTNLILSSKE